MGIVNALKYGALGFAADAFGLTGGLGSILGGMYGLLRPDANDMEQVHKESEGRYSNATSYTGYKMTDWLFDSPENPGERPKLKNLNLWKTGAVAGGALLLLSGSPFLVPFAWAGLAPYNLGGLIPAAWSSGAIADWAWIMPFVS